MKFKINTICFILLLFLIIGVASASDSDNETLQKTINEPDMELSQNHPDNLDTLELSVDKPKKLEAKVNNVEKLEAKKKSSSNSKTTTVKKTKVKISAPDVKMYFNDGSFFKITVKDEKKHAINNAKVKVEVEGNVFTAKTNSKGQIFLKIDMPPGKHEILTKFDETSKYKKSTEKSTITVKSTIKCSDLTKFYKKNTKYSATFYNSKGKVIKKTSVKFTLNGKTYSVKTNNKGIGSLTFDLKPGTYTITLKNSKTSESISKRITIKDILQTNDLTVNNENNSVYNVKVLDSNGRPVSNKQVTLKVDGKSYTVLSNSKGIASKKLDLDAGKYNIITIYEGIQHTNLINIKELVKHSPFSHIVSIPSYVNVTTPYVFYNSAYATKTGVDGIIRMPKNELFTIQISETKSYLFVQAPISGVDAKVIGYETHLIPFDGSPIQSAVNKEDLKGDGIIIYSTTNFTHIEYRNSAETNYDLFGVYMDRGMENSETITYVQNSRIKAKVNIYTAQYDELGVRYNLAKFYGKSIYDFNTKSYDEITNGNEDSIKFANTGKPVTYNLFGRSIVGYPSKEDIMTRFIINGKEELEKPETISYGLSDKYQKTFGFEVIQSYAIINEKITQDIVDNWISKSSGFTSRFGITNVYGMFISSLETAWLADEIADSFAKDLNVSWKRQSTTTILGGINLDDTYLHILNADMGMHVDGEEENSKLFRLMNSYYLPNIESYVLTPLANSYTSNSTNSLDNIYNSIENNNFSIVQMGEIFYIMSEDNTNSTIIINSTSGIAEVILIDDNFAYKGSKVSTGSEQCSVCTTTRNIIQWTTNTINKCKTGTENIINGIINRIHPMISLIYAGVSLGAGVIGKLAPSITTGFVSTVGLILQVHTVGNMAKNQMDKDSWHWAYKHATFTRDSPLENKKLFNIPKSDGTYDYIEVKINSDGSLNRDKALYVGDGYTKKLSKSETYNYFTEEKWTACNIPRKYQKNEVPLIFG